MVLREGSILLFLILFIIPLVYAYPVVKFGEGATTIILNTTSNNSLLWDGNAYSDLISQWTNDAGYITSFSDTNESLRFGNLTDTDCLGTDKVIGVYNNGTVMCGADTTGADTWQGNSSLVLNNITNWDIFYNTNASKNWTLDALNQGASFFWDINLGSYNATYDSKIDTFLGNYSATYINVSVNNSQWCVNVINLTYDNKIDTFAPNATGVFNNISINWTKKAYDEWGVWWFNQTTTLWNIFDILSDNITKWTAINNKISLDNGTINAIINNNASLWTEAKDKFNSSYASNIDTFAANQSNYSSLWNEALNKLNNSYRTIWNTTFSGNLTPDTTLMYDIGSGANRWSKLWAANISSENIDTYNLLATYNVSAGRFLGNTSCENITGAASNLCTITPFGDETDPIFQGNASGIFGNLSINFTNIVYTTYNSGWSSITNESYRTVDNFTGIFTPSMFNVTNISYVDIRNTSIVLAGQENRTKSDCANITGSVSDLCTLTPAGNEVDPVWQANSSIVFANLSTNWTELTIKLTNVTNDSYVSINNISVNRNQSLGALSQANQTYVPYNGSIADISLGKHNLSLNGSIEFKERTGIQDLFFVNPYDGDGFRMEYWYDFEAINDDWLIFRKTDGNDITPDGGIGFMMSNASGWNKTVLKLDSYGNANFTDQNIITTGNVTSSWLFGKLNWSWLQNIPELFTFADWNVTNETYRTVDNFTDIFTPSMFNVTNDSYVSINNGSIFLSKNFNVTNDSYISINNATANYNYTNDVFRNTSIVYTSNTSVVLAGQKNRTISDVANITGLTSGYYNINQTLGAILQINNSGGLMWIDLNNASVNQIISRNQTLNALIQVNNTELPSYNLSYESCLNNASYLSTYNVTYDLKTDTWVGNYSNITSWASTWQANYTNYTQLWTAANQWQNNQTNYTSLWNIALSWNNNYSNYTSLWNKANYNWTDNVLKNTTIVYVTNTSYLTNLNTSLVLINNATINKNWSNEVWTNWGKFFLNHTYQAQVYGNLTYFLKTDWRNYFDQSLNTTDAVVHSQINATTGYIPFINSTNIKTDHANITQVYITNSAATNSTMYSNGSCTFIIGGAMSNITIC